MYKILILFIILGFSSVSFAQTDKNKADTRVIEYFGAEKVQVWEQSHPDSLAFYNFVVQHVFEVYSKEYIQATKPENIIQGDFSEAEKNALTTNLSTFNVFNSAINWKSEKDQWYSIEGGQYYVLIHSFEYIQKKFNSGK